MRGLVADIGRHSVRFGLAADGDVRPRDVATYSTADHPTFTNALIGYLDRMGLSGTPLPSVLAVAGLTRGDSINLTGSRWFVSLSGVEAVLRVRPRALNECAANGLALTTLPSADFVPLAGPPLPSVTPGGNYLIVGPGTGLGVAALVTAGDRLLPLQTEAGHLGFATRTPEEEQVCAWLRARGTLVSNEALLSASGLVSIYTALAGRPTPALKPEDVTGGVLRDPVANRAVNLFIGALGAVVGDLVLAYGAWDGVFLSGAIARCLAPRLADPNFRRRLEQKDAFRRQLAQVPVAVVRRNDLELVGAAAALAAAA